MRDLEVMLKGAADPANARFVSRLCPTTMTILGIKTPVLERLLADLTKDERETLELTSAGTNHDRALWRGMAIATNRETSFAVKRSRLADWFPEARDWMLIDSTALRLKEARKELHESFLWFITLLSLPDPAVVRFALVLALSFYLTDDLRLFLLSEIATVTRRDDLVRQALGWFYQKAWTRYPALIEGLIPGLDPVLRHEIVKKIRASRQANPADKARITRLATDQ